MERSNKEVHPHEGVDLTAFLLQVMDRVGSWYEWDTWLYVSLHPLLSSMVRTPKNKLNKIREEMGRANKEVHPHKGVDLAAFLLWVKNRVGSGYERVKETTHSTSIDMKTVLLNSADGNIHKRIENWTTTTIQTTLKWYHQLGAIQDCGHANRSLRPLLACTGQRKID